MRYLLQTLLLSTTVMLAASCSDDEDTTNQNTGQVEFTMKGTNSSSSSGRVMSGLEITSATAAVTKIELESENDSIENETEFEGEYTVDLLTGVSDPAFGLVEVSAQTYDEMEIEFGTFLEGDASIIVKGNYTNDSGETIPFEYSLKKELEIEIENDGIEVSAGEVKEIAAELDFVTLFTNIDFGLVDSNADGLVIIDASINTYVYNLISQNVNAALKVEVEEED